MKRTEDYTENTHAESDSYRTQGTQRKRVSNIKEKRGFAYILIALALTLNSCTKEISLDLKTADPKLVIEALLTDNPEPYRVKLTRTTPYFQAGEDYVTSAFVTISDNAGNSDTLVYTDNGIYATPVIRQGVPGNTYTLSVLYNGQTYTAVSKMAVAIPLDSISFVYNEGGTFQDAGYNCAANFQDPPGQANFYRLNFYRNDTLMTDPFKYFVVDDELVEGQYITSYTPYTYQSGDSCKLELLSIDKEYYMFLTALSTQTQATGGPFDPIPSNPPTNISNGGLGFFGTAARSTKKIKLP